MSRRSQLLSNANQGDFLDDFSRNIGTYMFATPTARYGGQVNAMLAAAGAEPKPTVLKMLQLFDRIDALRQHWRLSKNHHMLNSSPNWPLEQPQQIRASSHA
ncbi:hypothetical protein [uncultured Tateyamaria sp.]|uniref:hypothetical protein n=1 Tax=uncultured Tateyamaria sp. TaxID=455651 RepID=UPI00261FF71B|nr:hypothetical protein [uncultured Tateyamaria sp.]